VIKKEAEILKYKNLKQKFTACGLWKQKWYR
jgi:hypothetical protein